MTIEDLPPLPDREALAKLLYETWLHSVGADWLAVADAALSSILASRQQEGWKLVPIEPTMQMLDAADNALFEDSSLSVFEIWEAMLAAAPGEPSPPRQQEGRDAARPMRIWIDTEFNEHEHRDELISMALVAEDGREFYEVVMPDSLFGPWVLENVVPKLGKAPIPHGEFARRLQSFLAPYPAVHIVGDWPTDIALFCDRLIVAPGQRINTPSLTMEVIRLDGESANPHNALADARGIRDAHLAAIDAAISAEGKS